MVFVFSYGSNSVAQLQARVENLDLVATPSRAINWRRIFCRNTPVWNGAAASIAPNEGGVVYGAVVNLSDGELEKLDKFESGYFKQEIIVQTFNDKEKSWNDSEINAIVYISKDSTWLHPPSEQYLTAIHVMLREQFLSISPEHVHNIDICGQLNSSTASEYPSDDEQVKVDVQIEKFYTWKYPGTIHLSLPSLVVEVNARRSTKWVMPRAINEIQDELQRELNIHSTSQLAVWLSKQNAGDSDKSETEDASVSTEVSSLTRDALKFLDAEAIILFKELLQIGHL